MKASTLTELIKALTTKKGTSPYDTQATVRRVDGTTLWVHIPGGVDETPVQKTVNAKPGDTVQVRVGGGRAWLVGNAIAPPTDDTTALIANETADVAMKRAKKAQETADGASKIAATTNQYFWHEESTGAHITEKPQDEFNVDPSNGGGNLLATSNGIAVRDGTTELATFGSTEATIGKTSSKHIKIGTGSVDVKSNSSTVLARFGIDSQNDASLQFGSGEASRVSGGFGTQSGIAFSHVTMTAYKSSNVNQNAFVQARISGDEQTVSIGASNSSKYASVMITADGSSSNISLRADDITINSVVPLKVATQYGGSWTIAANSGVTGNFSITAISGYSPVGIIGFFPDNGTDGSGETSAVVNRIYMNDDRTTVYYGMRNVTGSQIKVRIGVKILYASNKII